MDIRQDGHTVLSVHPGWAATEMGTMNGAVEAQIDIGTSVKGITDLIEQYRNDKDYLFLDYEIIPNRDNDSNIQPAISLVFFNFF